jgi:phosphoserine phosphatase RsbU/P
VAFALDGGGLLKPFRVVQEVRQMTELGSQLGRHALFDGLPSYVVEEIVVGARAESFAAGDVLMRQGETGDHAIVVVDGEVEILALTASGEVSLATVRGITLLGEIAVLADMLRTATVRATEPGLLLRVDGAIFRNVADQHPQILRHVVTRLGGQIGAYNRAVAVYTDALAALERDAFDDAMLDSLDNPSPELVNFSVTFRKMANQIRLRQRHREEMASAAAIQSSMLPDPLPHDREPARVDIFAAMRPAREVGGDFYDAFFLGPDRLAVLIGDVSGKGVPAALFMAVCQTTLRMALRDSPDDIGRALARANNLLEAENRTAVFATLFAVVIDLPNGSAVYCNCGHNPPLLLRADGGVEMLQPNATALGVIGGLDYNPLQVALSPRDRLLLYTDGVTEAHNPGEELFEDNRLVAAARKHGGGDVGALVDGVLAEVNEFAADAPQHDDITCFALAFRPAG